MNGHSRGKNCSSNGSGIQFPRPAASPPSREGHPRRNGVGAGVSRSQMHAALDRGGSTPSHRSHNSNRVRFPDDDRDDDDDDANHPLSNPLDVIVGLVTASLGCVCMAGMLTVLVLLYVVVRPFSLPVYRRLAMQFGLACFLDSVALLLSNMRIYLTGDSDVPSPVGTSVLVSNHLIDCDWWAMLMLGRCVGLRGNMKVFLRNEYLQVNMQQKTELPNTTTGSTGGGSNLRGSTALATSNSVFGHRNNVNRAGDLTIMAKLLHLFLDFPLVNGDEYISDREQLFQLMRSFAEEDGAASPVQFLSFPEGWSLHNGIDRRSILSKSNEFAQREGRPQLKHLLLPRTRGFNATLECLRESSPVVYDVTMAYSGYDGSLPPSISLSMPGMWQFLRCHFPKEIHIRIKRYSMEEVLQDASWLDKKWAEKDRLLSHFSRYQSFPIDGRGYCRHRVFDTWFYSLESSFISLFRLLLYPCFVPLILVLSIPMLWALLWIWLAHHSYRLVFPKDPDGGTRTEDNHRGGENDAGKASDHGTQTPYSPSTPFPTPWNQPR